MAKFTTVKCWYMPSVSADPAVLQKAEPTLQLVKKSILKNGYRAFSIQDRAVLEKQDWYPLFMGGSEVCFCIDGSGVYRLVNFDCVDNEFYFERMNVPVGHKPWVFYSWQSDFGTSRNEIKEALKEAIKYVNDNLKPRQPLELVESTRPEDGAKDIVAAIKENIARSLIAFFDITNVAQVKGEGKGEAAEKADKAKAKAKSYPNANVVFEMSYALHKKQIAQIVLVKKGRKDDLNMDGVPFDFQQNRRLDYAKPDKVKKEVKDILIAYLRSINFVQANI